MTPTLVQFHGSVPEMAELYAAIVHNCTCTTDPETGMPLGGCPAHTLLNDQKVLDGLAFSRWRTEAIALEEFS